MATVAEHYETHLAPIYLWMVGGFDAAVARGEAEIRAALSDLSAGAVAVDLGAGFGMHSIPLARRGCFVVALDTSPILLRELQVRADDLPICAVEADLLSFQAHLTSVAQVILCMGDTLTHLPTRTEVETLFMRAAASLASGGRFILSFRDYATPLEGTERFISVKSDTDRILSCFLEYASDRVVVHDVLHERVDSSWQLRVSAYEKLRLSPPWVVAALERSGFSVRSESGLSGMIRIVATCSQGTTPNGRLGFWRAFMSCSRELDDREKLVDPPGRSHGCRELKDAWDLPAIRVTHKDHPDDLTNARLLQDRGAEICRAAPGTGSKCTWITCWSPAPSSATSNQRAGSDGT